jgi:NADH-quinone oxidoreductase subunit G
LRNADFTPSEGVRHLGTSIASLSTLQRVLVVGSNLRKDHPLFAQRIRQAARKGCAVSVVGSAADLTAADAWAMPIAQHVQAPASQWLRTLASIASAVASEKNVQAPVAADADDAARAVAQSLLKGERKAVLLGNGAAHHAQASALLALAQWIATETGATFGYLGEAANTVGAQFVHAEPSAGGLNAAQMLAGGLKAVLLLNNEPEFDSAAGAAAASALSKSGMVVTLSPFKTNLAFSDVLLPIAPFTETSGSFVNAEGLVQSFHAVVKPLAEARPAWKVLRVLGNLLGLSGFEFESSQDVLRSLNLPVAEGTTRLPADRLNNASRASIDLSAPASATEPAVASLYQLDSLVRRATSLQLTADARLARGESVKGATLVAEEAVTS